MTERQERAVMYGITAVIVIWIVLVVLASVHEARAWAAFREEHHCRLVGHVRGQNVVTVGASGKVGTAYIPSRDSFLCDDGITYTR